RCSRTTRRSTDSSAGLGCKATFGRSDWTCPRSRSTSSPRPSPRSPGRPPSSRRPEGCRRLGRRSDHRTRATRRTVMSNEIVRWLIVLVVLAHGVGHVLFLAPAVGIANWADQSGHSWLLSGAVGEAGTRIVASAVWIAAVICFVGAVVGFLTGAEWWRSVILAGAVVSGVGI